ncbi:ABC transporter substrate-binding protein [Faunimonas sp. B44]|uniref:ABC transporter substrate-binding protein n=1 Tax=Faunimonas sp. B44 TaxID=3461493 RepID=UPI0040445767
MKLGATLALAASSAFASSALAQDRAPLAFAYQTSIAGGSLMVTEVRDLWGIPVKSSGFVAGSDVLQAVLSGSAQAGSMAVTPTITGGQTGDFRIVAVANRVGHTTAIVVPPDSDIKTVADLKGKTLAVQQGTTTSLDIDNYVLPHFNLKPEDVRQVNMNMGDMPAALGGGRVDAIASVEPYISIAVQQGIGKRIQSIGDFDPLPVFIVIRTEYLEGNEEVVVDALRGYYSAVEWIKDNPEETVDIIRAKLDELGVGVPREVVDMAWKTVDLDVSFDEAQMKAYLTEAAELLLKAGKIERIPDFDTILRLDLARNAME